MLYVTEELFSHVAYTPCYCEENIWQIVQSEFLKDYDKWVVFISNDKKAVPFWGQKMKEEKPFGQYSIKNLKQRLENVVFWDYHVICIVKPKMKSKEDLVSRHICSQVYDFDSGHNCIVDLKTYLKFTFRYQQQSDSNIKGTLMGGLDPIILASDYKPHFRVIKASHYIKNFASDRSHMIKRNKEENGSSSNTAANNTGYISEPPSYPCICTDKEINNLSKYLDCGSIDIELIKQQNSVEWLNLVQKKLNESLYGVTMDLEGLMTLFE